MPAYLRLKTTVIPTLVEGGTATGALLRIWREPGHDSDPVRKETENKQRLYT